MASTPIAILILRAMYVFPVAIMTFVITMRVYQDMHTLARKSILHRREAPKLTPLYKAVNYLSAGVGLCYCVTLLSTSFDLVFGLSGTQPCSGLNTIHLVNGTGVIAAKTCMYLILLIRLHMIFRKTPFEYSPLKLKMCAAVLVLVELLTATMYFIGLSTSTDPCSSNVTINSFILVFGALLVLTDMVCAIAFLVAFISPVRKLLKMLDSSAKNQNENEKKVQSSHDRNTGKFYYVKVKVATLTMVAVVSTVVFMVLGFVLPISARWILETDWVVNLACVAFMTNYFPDARYYQRVCCCFIRCCTPKSAAYQSTVRVYLEMSLMTNSRSGTVTQTGTSVDTADQPRNMAVRMGDNRDSDEDITYGTGDTGTPQTAGTDVEIVFDH
jgi:hypothetical protein